MKLFKKMKFSKKLLSALLCALLILPAVPVAANTIEEIESQQATLQTKKQSLQEKIDSLKTDENSAQEYSQALQDKMDVIETSIDTTRENINTLNANILDLEEKLEESQSQYADTLELLKVRIKAIYKTGDIGTIEILLNSTSLYDFSLRTETLKSVTQHDTELMNKIKDYMDKTKEDREALTAQKEEVAKLQKQLESNHEELRVLNEENKAVIISLQSEQAEVAEQITHIEEEDYALNAELERLMAEKAAAEEEARRQEEANNNANSGGESDGDTVYVPPTGGSSGGLSCLWPTPGYGTNYITQYYGNNGHSGLDIGAPYGAPIIASASGEVLSASYHWSWGNNVLVYHNGTYSTRYAHMSTMIVSAGEYVSAGQTIGYIGSTGNSTGPHLHFEVYQNGTRVNPSSFL